MPLKGESTLIHSLLLYIHKVVNYKTTNYSLRQKLPHPLNIPFSVCRAEDEPELRQMMDKALIPE